MSDLARDDWLSDIRAFCERLYAATDEREIDTLIGEAACLLEVQAKALEPFACLEVPKRAKGNAGLYSLRFADIERAQAALTAAKARP